jgi:histidine phosphotransferase ChpT
MGPAELKRLAEGYLTSQKAELAWDADALVLNGPEGGGKLLLNLIALAVETLQRGGTIRVEAAGDGQSVRVAGEGTNARLRDETRAAIANGVDVDQLSPRAVQGYFSRLIAQRMGGDLQVQEADGAVSFQVQLSG